MKSINVSILKKRKHKVLFKCLINFGFIIIINMLLIAFSCTKSDDLETIDNESPINNQSLIVYTDIEPDFNSENGFDFYDLDLNNDGIIDFHLNLLESWSFWAEPYSNEYKINALAAVSGPFESYIIPLNKNSVISSKLEFPIFFDSYGGYMVMELCESYPTYCSYSWKGKNDVYLGLKIILNGQTHYGWARLDVTSATQWVIKDYAFNATPNKPILAGQKE